MSFKTLTAIFVSLSIASGLATAALLFNVRVPYPALLCLTFLNSAAFGGMVLTYRDSDVQTRLRITAFIGILSCTALANALQDVYGWITFVACGLPFVLAALFRYVIRRY
jgi:hypothetical protein